MVLRVHPYEETLSEDIHFELDGLDKIVGALFGACRWDPTKKIDKGQPIDSP